MKGREHSKRSHLHASGPHYEEVPQEEAVGDEENGRGRNEVS